MMYKTKKQGGSSKNFYDIINIVNTSSSTSSSDLSVKLVLNGSDYITLKRSNLPYTYKNIFTINSIRSSSSSRSLLYVIQITPLTKNIQHFSYKTKNSTYDTPDIVDMNPASISINNPYTTFCEKNDTFATIVY